MHYLEASGEKLVDKEKKQEKRQRKGTNIETKTFGDGDEGEADNFHYSMR